MMVAVSSKSYALGGIPVRTVLPLKMGEYLPLLRTLADNQRQLLDTSVVPKDRFSQILAELDGNLDRTIHLAGELTSNFGRSPLLAEQRLRTMIFNHHRQSQAKKSVAPEIFSVAIVLPMTNWNGINSTLATDMKHAVYQAARDFFSGDQEGSKNRGETTIVNGSIIALQLNSVERLPEFLSRLEVIVATQFPSGFNLKLFRLGELCSGVAKYDGDKYAGEIPAEPRRNITPILRQVKKLRDLALQRAEAMAILAGRGQLAADQRIAFADVAGVDVSHKMVWREGRLLEKKEILATLQRIVSPDNLQSEKNKKRSRDFKTMSREDLESVAELARVEGGLNNLDALAEAVQKLFEQPLTDARVLALFEQAGGTFEPDRDLRQLEDLQKMVRNFHTRGAAEMVSADLFGMQRELSVALAGAVEFVRDIGFEVRDRHTRVNKELAAHAAVEMVENFYEGLAYREIPREGDDGYAIIGFEAMQAQALDLEVNPITHEHWLDVNMLKLKMVGHRVAERYFGKGADGSVNDCVEVFAMGDELAVIFPQHDRNGQRLDMKRLAQVFRDILRELFPELLHYAKKINSDGKTLRRKQYQATIQEKSMMIATDPEALAGRPGDRRVWILEQDGVALNIPVLTSLDAIQIMSIKNVMGPVDCRLCVDLQPLALRDPGFMTDREAKARYLLKRINAVLDADNKVKKQTHPNRGIYALHPETGELEQVGL